MTVERLRQDIRAFLQFSIPDDPIAFETHTVVTTPDYDRLQVTYHNDAQDRIPAFLLPHGPGPFPAILVQHQHHGQWHLGQSDVCGLAGDPLQAFGPVLAHHGLVVLAIDALCFEERRTSRAGIAPSPDTDWLQHYNQRRSLRLIPGESRILTTPSASYSAVPSRLTLC